MISIKEPKDCCGCNACTQKCPKHCIVLQEDYEGFLYPKVNTDLCIDCGLCEKVCPVINQEARQEPLHVYAAINLNERIRYESSSGGIFTLFAEQIIQEQGVVFGACFDENWEVKHTYTETIEGISAFRGSKYIQSRIEDNFIKVEKFLKSGRKVLFSGTPCQIAGLKRFLRKDYENLLTVDFICHGVPSPKIWRMYLDEMYRNLTKHKSRKSTFSNIPDTKKNIETINFRHKALGWKEYSFFIKYHTQGESKEFSELFKQNMFMKAFLSDMILRPSCYHCPAKNGKSQSDITIADFWHIHRILRNFDDDKGTSLVFMNNSKGKEFFHLIIDKIRYEEVRYYDVKPLAKGLREVLNEHKNRTLFFSQVNNNQSIIKLIKQTTRPTFTEKIFSLKKKIMRKIKRAK